MTSLLEKLFALPSVVVCLVVAALVFAEDALFFGFVIPGETAAIIGGVIASRGHLSIGVIIACVVVAAIIGDTVGYEIGRRYGNRLLDRPIFDKRRKRLDDAQHFLRRRGGGAVFLGRFVAFFRAVMPALAGTARMHYPKFLLFNAAGGIVWGVGFTLLGYLAGNSYAKVEKTAGRAVAFGAAGIVLVAVVIWQVRKFRADRRADAPDAPDQSGIRPDQSGSGPDQSGSGPDQSGDAPDQSGAGPAADPAGASPSDGRPEGGPDADPRPAGTA